MAEADAVLANATANAERMRGLLRERVISQAEADDAERAERVATRARRGARGNGSI